MDPLVSVIIPARGRADLLLEALASVSAQTYARRETVVIDDASTEDLAAIARRAGFRSARFMRNRSGLGPAAARNRGLAAARGEYVAFLDSDDLWRPGKLELQVRTAQETGAEFVHSAADALLPSGRLIPRMTESLSDWISAVSRRFYDGPVATSTVLMKRGLALSAGGFDSAMGYFDDVDFWWRLGERLPHRRRAYLRRPLAVYRVHARRLSADAPRRTPQAWLESLCLARRWSYCLEPRLRRLARRS